MGVDNPKRLFLLLQVLDDARQHRMLDDIGKVSGVIGVAVVHAAGLSAAIRLADGCNNCFGAMRLHRDCENR
jgi:hypothetical protein